VILLLFGVTGFAYLTFYERRALARIQARIGPNRAGPFGVLQPLADGLKLIFKEELIPARADKVIFLLAPVITVLPAFIIWAVIPWGGQITLFGRQISLYLTDINCWRAGRRIASTPYWVGCAHLLKWSAMNWPWGCHSSDRSC